MPPLKRSLAWLLAELFDGEQSRVAGKQDIYNWGETAEMWVTCSYHSMLAIQNRCICKAVLSVALDGPDSPDRLHHKDTRVSCGCPISLGGGRTSPDSTWKNVRRTPEFRRSSRAHWAAQNARIDILRTSSWYAVRAITALISEESSRAVRRSSGAPQAECPLDEFRTLKTLGRPRVVFSNHDNQAQPTILLIVVQFDWLHV
ncbi:hypothetical protein DFH28DRAFT_135304 [Melampsora americana]|nr:hypothetical protein DFH28DRAFT_135304 [Melampsora americana]